MSRFTLLSHRLLERRLLGDGERMASIIPGTLAPLTLSLLLFAVILPERPLYDAALLLSVATFIWSASKTFLESHDLDAAALDRAILSPLPIPNHTLAAARTLVVGVLLAFSTFNIALPVFVLVAIKYDLLSGLLILLSAFLAALMGLALAQAIRAVLERLLGLGRVRDWEGPLRLVVGVALFTLLFLAPDPTGLLSSQAWLRAVPPISFASLVDPAHPSGPLLGSLAGVLSAVLLALFAFRVAGSGAESRGTFAGRTGPSMVAGCVRRWFVRPEEQFAFDFALANQSRDRTFRSRVYPLFAFPLAVIVLVAERPEEPTLVLMALYGATVYLALAEVFQAYSESRGGPDLLSTLPIRNPSAFRLGAEKAFIAGLVLPIYLVLAFCLLGLSLLGRGFGLVESLGHTLLATEFGILTCSLTFLSVRDYAFSITDQGVYPGNLSSGPFAAILLGGLAAVLAGIVVENPLLFLVSAVTMALLIRGLFAIKRRTLAVSLAET